MPVKPAALPHDTKGKKLAPPIAKGNVGVTEFLMEGEVADIQWVGHPRRNTVLVLTTRSNLYRSSDEGKTWRNVVSGLPALVLPKGGQPGQADTTNRKVKKLIVSPVDSNCVFVAGEGTNHWVTQDGGRTFKAVNSVVKFHDVIMHPTNKARILASTMAPKCHDTKADGVCYKSVYATADFGATWIKATDYVVQFDWAQNLGNHQADTLPETAMFATVFRSQKGNQRFGYWDKNIDFVRTDDFFRTPGTVLVKHGNRFLFTKKFLFVAQVNPLHDTEVELQMSSDGAKTFLRGTLPYRIKQHSYTILDTSEDTVFLHVNHEGEGAKWGNVYISNADGLNYTLSLPHNSREATGKCDFEKIEGLEGIYLANFVDMVGGGDADDTTDDDTMSQEGSVKKKTAGKKPPPKVRTVITFDKGGVWSYLHAPRVDANGKKVDCQSADCSLHLHGVTDQWGPFYSTATSIGLIMATGNIGTSLSDNGDEINTYFSRDAGLTWDEVAKGSHIYEFGDHGGLIVMANDVKATDTVFYSWNEGLSWTPFVFTQKPVEIDNIIIEPSATSQKFMIYGSRTSETDKNSEPVGVVYFLDFGELHTTQCKGVEAPGSPESDYEKWSPSDGRLGDSKCMLGHQVTYTRRKRDQQCYNGEALQRSTFVKNCACAESDFECDVGFSRDVDGGPCKPLSGVVPLTTAPANCQGTWYIPNGYRRVAGDTCSGGTDQTPAPLPCPHWTNSVSHGGWVVLLIVACLVGGLCQAGARKRAAADAGSSSFAYDSGASRMTGCMNVALSSITTVLGLVWSLTTCCCRKKGNEGTSYAGYAPVGKGSDLVESAAGYDTYEDKYGDFNDDEMDESDEFEEEDEDAVSMATPGGRAGGQLRNRSGSGDTKLGDLL